MFLEVEACRGMGTGGPDGPRDFLGLLRRGDPVALPL